MCCTWFSGFLGISWSIGQNIQKRPLKVDGWSRCKLWTIKHRPEDFWGSLTPVYTNMWLWTLRSLFDNKAAIHIYMLRSDRRQISCQTKWSFCEAALLLWREALRQNYKTVKPRKPWSQEQQSFTRREEFSATNQRLSSPAPVVARSTLSPPSTWPSPPPLSTMSRWTGQRRWMLWTRWDQVWFYFSCQCCSWSRTALSWSLRSRILAPILIKKIPPGDVGRDGRSIHKVESLISFGSSSHLHDNHDWMDNNNNCKVEQRPRLSCGRSQCSWKNVQRRLIRK